MHCRESYRSCCRHSDPNRSRRFSAAATQIPAIGPNSGPTIIAPMIRIDLVE